MSEASNVVPAWGKDIGTETIAGIEFRIYTQRPQSISEILTFADRWNERPHIVQGDRTVTFADLRRAVAAQAAHLSSQGLQAGQLAFVLGWNGPEWIVNFWALVTLGAVPVLANSWWSAAELADSIEALSPALILADKTGAARLPPNVRAGDWTPPGSKDGTSTLAVVPADEESPAAIIFTSGTEGRPKAVVLSHRGLLAGLQMLLHITKRLPHQVDDSAGDAGLHTGPLFHIGGVQTLLRSIIVGDTLVMPRSRFDPGEALALIEQHRIRRWAAVPTMVSRLLDHPDIGTRDVSSLRSLTVGGAPVHAELLERIGANLPSVQARIPTGYGLTENGGQATASSGADTAARPGQSGRPLPCVELRFEEREGLPDGEIMIRSPTQMSGYYGLQTSPIDADGWLRTGDLGKLDDRGQLWITGRCKDMIIRGGENIAPVAVERALMAIPGVAEVAVFGIPHPDLGEEVMAVVMVQGDMGAAQLQESLKGSVSSFAIPTVWRVTTEPLLTNHAGKVDKAALATEARLQRAPKAA